MPFATTGSMGVSDDHPGTVFVVELWESPEAHQASLRLGSVRAAITEAMPLLTGEMSRSRFTVVGSPLRPWRGTAQRDLSILVLGSVSGASSTKGYLLKQSEHHLQRRFADLFFPSESLSVY